MTAEKAPIHAESMLQLWTCLSLEPTLYIGPLWRRGTPPDKEGQESIHGAFAVFSLGALWVPTDLLVKIGSIEVGLIRGNLVAPN